MVASAIKPVKGEPRDSYGSSRLLSKDDNEPLLHNDPSGWAFVLSLKTIGLYCAITVSYRTGFTPWRLKLV